MFKHLSLYLLLAISIGSFSQLNISFNPLGISEGLSNSFVFDINQDSKGFIWIATSNGLNRYDGYKIKIFQNDPLDSNSISFNTITSIEEDADGNLWLGTRGNGLICYNHSTDNFRDVIPTNKDISIKNIQDLEFDQDDILWIAGDRGIFSYDYKANKQPIGKFEINEDYTTHQFELEKEDVIYIFSDGYVDQFGGPKGKKFKAGAFKKLLLNIQDKSMKEQHVLIDKAFKDWKGKLEQIDDVCVIGMKFN